MYIVHFLYGAITLYGQPSQVVLIYTISQCCSPTTPRMHASLVWALSRSLATTWEITIVFSSSPYLDVSVQEVRLTHSRDTYK